MRFDKEIMNFYKNSINTASFYEISEQNLYDSSDKESEGNSKMLKKSSTLNPFKIEKKDEIMKKSKFLMNLHKNSLESFSLFYEPSSSKTIKEYKPSKSFKRRSITGENFISNALVTNSNNINNNNKMQRNSKSQPMMDGYIRKSLSISEVNVNNNNNVNTPQYRIDKQLEPCSISNITESIASPALNKDIKKRQSNKNTKENIYLENPIYFSMLQDGSPRNRVKLDKSPKKLSRVISEKNRKSINIYAMYKIIHRKIK